MQTVLTRAELEAHDPEGGRGGRWLCPLPGVCAEHTNPRKHRSLHVEDSGLWNCHRCKAGGQLKDNWKAFTPRSRWEVKEEARKRRESEEARKLEAIGKRFKARGKPLSAVALAGLSASGQAPAAVVAPVENGSLRSADASPRTVHPELKEVIYRAGSLQGLDCEGASAFLSLRGFAGFAEILQRARVKFAPDFGRREATEEKKAYRGTAALVFPISDDAGQLVAFQGRKTEPGGDLKVLTFGPKTRGLFWGPGAREAFQRGEALAVTEAPLDALSLAVCGVPAVALCGSSVLPEFLSMRCFGRRYWLAFDADGPGDEAAKVIGAELARFGGIVARLRPTEAKDWNEALQAGGELWEREARALMDLTGGRSAVALLPLLGSEASASELSRAKAGQVEGEHGRSELAEVGRELEQVGAPALPELKEVETECPSGIEQNGTEKGPAEKAHFVPFQTAISSGDLYGDRRQEVLSWALAEARRETLPEPSEALALPSGQRIAAGGAAAWLQEAQKRAEALSLMGAVSVDAERAFLVVRQDMRALSILAADAARELRLLAELEALAAELESVSL